MEKENKELTSTYGEDIVNRIKNIISELDIEYYRRLKVSEELYNDLKTSRYDLIFFIRSSERNILGEEVKLADLIETKEKLAILKEKNNNIKEIEARLNELYHILSKATHKVAFYASRVDFSKKIKRSMKK